MTNPTTVIAPLTGARFFAALYVLLMHSMVLIPFPDALLPFLQRGNLGVSFFFVLSGFVLTYRYADTLAQNPGRQALRRYFAARLARIFPMHVLALLLMTALLFSTGFLRLDGKTLLVWIANLLALHVYVPEVQFQMQFNAPSWSVGTELFFYALFPFILPILARRATSPAAILTLFGQVYLIELALLALGSSLIMTSNIPDILSLADFLLDRNPLFRIWEFIAGCIAGLGFLRLGAAQSRILRNEAARNALLAAAIVLIVASTYTPGGKQSWLLVAFSELRRYPFYTPLFVLIVLCLASGRTFLTALLSHRHMVLLGDASYSLYLLHWVTLGALAFHFMQQQKPVPLGSALAAVVVTVALSVICFTFVERPARAAIKRRTALARNRYAGHALP